MTEEELETYLASHPDFWGDWGQLRAVAVKLHPGVCFCDDIPMKPKGTRGETGYGLFVNGFGDEGGRPDILAGLCTVARGKQLVGCVN